MKTPFTLLKHFTLSASVVLALAACESGTEVSTNNENESNSNNNEEEIVSSATAGIALPTEISAVPIQKNNPSLSKASFSNRLMALSNSTAELSQDSDYHTTATRKYIEERALEQFDIIEQLLKAIGQTHYADASVINQGPYTAIITWEDEQDGRDIKTLQPWVVESKMILENDVEVNRVQAWIEEPDRDNPGQIRLLKAEFKVYSAATTAEDGTYTDYGNWELNVAFNEEASSFFVLTSASDNGVSTIKMNESMSFNDFSHHVKGILNRSAETGYGKVAYPDWHSCDTHPCQPETTTTAYAYNSDYLAVQSADDLEPAYKDRNPDNAIELTHRYGVFFAESDSGAGIAAGDSLEKHKAFGFPIQFLNEHNLEQHAYYGAWQGRHEIWGGNDLEPGDTVTRNDHHNDSEEAASFIVSQTFNGTLTKRTLTAGSLSDIANIVVETWINKHYELRWDASANSGAGAWQYCDGWIDWSQNPALCHDFESNEPVNLTEMTDFSILKVGEEDRKFVHISGWDPALNNGNGGPVDYVYLGSTHEGVNWSGAGFYPAEHGEHGRLTPMPNATRYAPEDSDTLWINIDGSLFIAYTGTEWVQKELESFDEETWTPTFNDSADTPFTLEIGREYYINNQGANYIVRRIDDTGSESNDYQVMTELQTAANPKNITSILPLGTDYLAAPWQPEVKFTLGQNPEDSGTFMKLTYANDDPNTPDKDETGTRVEDGQWGLQAYDSSDMPLDASGSPVSVDGYGLPVGDATPVQFNWEYSEEGWGTQQFLCSPDCSAVDNYLILSDPVRFQPLAATNHSGAEKTLSLAFDGWMHGLPDLYFELHKNDFVMSSEIADKVINLSAGTELVDASDNTVRYYLKPLDVSIFLNVVTQPADGLSFPDITLSESADLTTVPDYTDTGMGDKPTDTEIRFSEGIAIQ
ncbi:MAG: hypothetical protein MJA28_07925 [Gammaproteobacteria bacterium]|nr:hypothetical protein [Gammaproteobacteria bacterium]